MCAGVFSLVQGAITLDTALLADAKLDTAWWRADTLRLGVTANQNLDHPEVQGCHLGQKISGDFYTVIDIVSIAGRGNCRAGVAIRYGKGPDSTVAALFVNTDDRHVWWHYREANGVETSRRVDSSWSGRISVQIRRRNDTIWIAESEGGSYWHWAIPGYLIRSNDVWVGPMVVPQNAGDSSGVTCTRFWGFAGGDALPSKYATMGSFGVAAETLSVDTIRMSGRLFDIGDTTLEFYSPKGVFETISTSNNGHWEVKYAVTQDGDYELRTDWIGTQYWMTCLQQYHIDRTRPVVSLYPYNQDMLNRIPLKMKTTEKGWIYWRVDDGVIDSVCDTVAYDTLRIGDSGLLKTWAIDMVGNASDTVKRRYHVHKPCSSWADPPGNTFNEIPVKVRIRFNNPGAVAKYTLDGSPPNSGSSTYTGGFFQFFKTTTLKFYAGDLYSIENVVHEETYTLPAEPVVTYLTVGYDSDKAEISTGIVSPNTFDYYRITMRDNDGVIWEKEVKVNGTLVSFTQKTPITSLLRASPTVEVETRVASGDTANGFSIRRQTVSVSADKPFFAAESDKWVVAGHPLGIGIDHYNPLSGTAEVIASTENPGWTVLAGDSIYGTPDSAGTDTIVVFLKVDSEIHDTLKVVVSVLKRPFFTSADSVRLVVGDALSYDATWQDESGKNAGMGRFLLPHWVNRKNAHFSGTPSKSGVDTIGLHLGFEGTWYDTLMVRIFIVDPTPGNRGPWGAVPEKFDFVVRRTSRGIGFLVGVEKACDFELLLFDVAGRKINGHRASNARVGYHQILWKDSQSCGIFFACLQRKGKRISKKVLLLD